MSDTPERRILVLSTEAGDARTSVGFLGRQVYIDRTRCEDDFESVERLLASSAEYSAVALEGIPLKLALGQDRTEHEAGAALRRASPGVPVVDGAGVRAGLERWGVTLVERAQPGILAEKRVLMVPGLNHGGMASALSRITSHLRYADPALFFGLPRFPGVGSRGSLGQAAPATLRVLRTGSLRQLRSHPDPKHVKRARRWFDQAEVLAGDLRTIRLFAPQDLSGKIVLAEFADEEQLEELRRRGAEVVITLMPSLVAGDDLGRHSAASLEALLASLRPDPALPLSENTYLDMISEFRWTPCVRHLQEGGEVSRFAFVIHPLNVKFIHKHPSFRWTRYFPDALVESLAARMPPFHLATITGGRSAATGRRIEGHLISLAATPREMMRRGPAFTYRRLEQAARMAQSRGARLMGLGAFTSVVGDAGITVARDSPIPITSGNSLTVAATLEAAKQAAVRMGAEDLSRGKAMVIGATGSIGAVCARMIALAVRDVVLVSIEPEKLIELKRRIREEAPGARVIIATESAGLVEDRDLIVSATSGFGQRVLDISRCKPGAIVCDVARPADIGPAEAALRPDVLVIESGEVLIPGEVDFGYDIGLPEGVAYACLGETALLAMDDRFESFTLGRELRVERVKEIHRMFQRHGFKLAGLRSFGALVSEEDFAEKRGLAERLRRDPALLAATREEASRALARIPRSSKGVRAGHGRRDSRAGAWLGEGLRALSRRLGGG